MLRHFDQTFNGSVATYFILLNSTAKSSATGDYVAVPERFCQIEEPAKEPSSIPKNTTEQRTGQPCNFVACNYVFLVVFDVNEFFNYSFPIMEYLLMLYLYYFLLSWRENKHFDVHYRRIWTVYFPSKNGKNAVYEWRIGWKGSYFPPESAFFLCIYYDWIYFSLFVPWLGGV